MIRLLSFFANGFYRKISCFLCSEVRASSFVVIYNAALSRIRFSVASVCVKNMRFCYHQKPIGREPYAGDNGTNYQKTAEIVEKLKECAEGIHSLDMRMQEISEYIDSKR